MFNFIAMGQLDEALEKILGLLDGLNERLNRIELLLLPPTLEDMQDDIKEIKFG